MPDMGVSEILGAGSIITGIMGADAAGDAANVQAAAARDAAQSQLTASRESNALIREMWQQGRADQLPWLQAGGGALNRLAALMQPGGSLYEPFNAGMFKTEPGYQFRLSEGNKAINRAMSARGLNTSGAALKALTRYGQDYASNEYNNAYNRYTQNQSNQFNRLAALSGVGQTTAQQLGAAGMNAGTTMGANLMSGAANASNALMSGAAARASGFVGGVNALSGGIANAGNMYMQNQLLSRILGGGANVPLVQGMVPGQFALDTYG